NAIGTTVTVKTIECLVSESPSKFFQYTPAPSLSATEKTLMTGITTNTPTRAIAKRVKLHCSQTGSFCALRTASVFMTHTPAFDPVDQHQHCERKNEQDHRNCGGFPIGKLLETRDDQDRSNLRLIRLVPRDKNHGAVFAYTAGKGERETG